LASTSPEELARELLRLSLVGAAWPEAAVRALAGAALDPDPARSEPGTKALFAELVEPLADRFDPTLCDVYAREFSRLLSLACADLDADSLAARYGRIRAPRTFDARPGSVRAVVVLSRITLGADVAVTSVMLDAAKRRFPNARIVFAGPRKCYELFAADPRIEHLEIPYPRGGALRDRLSAWPLVKQAAAQSGTILIDPDSRITQLGLLPAGEEENYYFFESRAYGGDGDAPLGTLACRWASETFGVEDARAYIAPLPPPVIAPAGITVSLGVGENPAKRVQDPFEAELLARLAATGLPLLVDRGAGGEEAARVDGALRYAGVSTAAVRTWNGAFAPFAGMIASSRLFVGYDSAGGHVAAARGTPLVSVFAGFPSVRMFDRWRPSGGGSIRVVKVDAPEPAQVLAETLAALEYSTGKS
jgi:ADP-heptose:LPS heptosyltransferase